VESGVLILISSTVVIEQNIYELGLTVVGMMHRTALCNLDGFSRCALCIPLSKAG
jgi:hypothetical protein